LFPFFLCAYKILNPTNANEKGLSNFASQSFQSTSFNDVMESANDMAISMVKEQLNYFKIKKVNKEECKNLVA